MDPLLYGFFALVGLVAGGGLVYAVLHQRLRSTTFRLEVENRQRLDNAKQEAENLKRQAIIDAREALLQDRSQLEAEIKEQRNELGKLERRAIKKEETLDRKLNQIEQREQHLEKQRQDLERAQERLKQKEGRIDELVQAQQDRLEQISALTREEAKRQLLDALEDEARKDGAVLARKIVDEAQENAEQKAKYHIANAIQRCASEYVAETTVSVVDLPNDEMKGRIIGREGRNIRALEVATGIDLIIDDTPECVILSGFDPVKRHIAAQTLKRLISDGRIHPARIEETVGKVKKEVNKHLRELGKNAAFEVGIHGLNDDLIQLLGRLNFRTSYTQNVLRHSIEVAFISGMIATELGANAKLAKRAGLLHDIGKALDQAVEGPHAVIGAEFARKHGESEEIVRAIGAHHHDWEPKSLEAIIVLTADALSAARPGARREVLQSYIKRLEELEAISRSFPGVDKTYAIQAGREVRIIVEPNSISDEAMQLLARDIAKKIEAEVDYPGEIKVTIIRETRTVEYAR
jgi:ribonucrease Y